MTSKYKYTAHNKPISSSRLNQRIAEEAQLLAEEKWIIEALKKIKLQRNGLQIERLHLESMRSKLLKVLNPEQKNEPPAPDQAFPANEDMPIDSQEPTHETNTCSFSNTVFQNQNFENDELCNLEELNLSVTNSIFDSAMYGPTCEEEEEEEEEEEDMENCLLDMDLLMCGK